jgi:16S rRNA (guanine527-N7)-methyltransferase
LGIIIKKIQSLHIPVKAARIADVGSGAGLPGIPLAIVLQDNRFTLIERKGRRAGFLRGVIKTLNLINVVVEEEEMEKVKPGRFDIVTFRAFRPLEPKMFKKLSRLCPQGGTQGGPQGGILAAYKGRHDKASAEMAELEKALPHLAGRWELIPCPVPMLDEQRHLLLVNLLDPKPNQTKILF